MSYIKEKSPLELDLEQMSESTKITVDMVLGNTINGHKLFWSSPQEYCDLAGTNAYKLFQDHIAAQEFLAKMIPDYIPLGIPDEYEQPVFNNDLTVTIKKKLSE